MKKREKVAAPLIAVLLGLLVGMIIVIASGKSPVLLISAIVKSFCGFDILAPGPINPRYFGEFIVFSMPLILTGLAVGFAYRTGLFNIGGEGQVMVGALAATVVGILVPLPPVLHAIVCLIAGGVAGALWAFLPGFLKVKRNISEVVTAIMMNYAALYFCNYILKALPGSTQTRTVDLPASALIKSDFLKQITNNSRLHWGILVVILAVIVYHIIIEKTTFGYSLRATGFNAEGARYAGMKVERNVVYAMMISGVMAGLAGAIMVLGTFGYGRVLNTAENYGFDGIAVALVGGCNAIGIFFAGLLFGLLKVAQPLMQSMQIPKDIATIISSTIIMLVAMQNGIIFIMNRLSKKKETAEKGSEQA